MNLKSLSYHALIFETKTAVDEERKATLKVLKHFREISDRRAFMGYSSLFELAVEEFGYSPPAAQRRIEAMRLLRDMPEYESKFASGALTVTAAASIQSYFKRSNTARGEKVFMVNACLNKSTREVSKKIAALEPKADKRPDMRFTKNDRIRMSLNISEELYQKLEKLKFLRRCSSIEEVLNLLADNELKSLPAAEIQTASHEITSANSLPAPKAATRNIPAATKRIVLKNSQPKCTYKDPKTGEECKETSRLELDHINPYSKGGPHLVENLRILCSHHNKYVWHTEQK